MWDIQVDGAPEEDKQITVEIEIHKDSELGCCPIGIYPSFLVIQGHISLIWRGWNRLIRKWKRALIRGTYSAWKSNAYRRYTADGYWHT